MYVEFFPKRLSFLRTRKGVSARDMSLSIGQNPGYINNIETGKALPSMTVFFYMCEYFGISPKEFFEGDVEEPEQLRNIISDLKMLDSEDLQSIANIVAKLAR